MLDTHFRQMPSEGFPQPVLTDPCNPLVLIKKDGLSTYANKQSEKKDLVETYQAGDLLLFIWQGKFRSDVFEVKADKVSLLGEVL